MVRFDKRADRAALSTVPKASLTAALVGKAAAISGSSRTIFVPAAKRAAYFPRTMPPGKSERLYSERSPLLVDALAFFIDFTFRLGCESSIDNSNNIPVFGM